VTLRHPDAAARITLLESPSNAVEVRRGSGPLVVSMPHAGTGLPSGIAARLAPGAMSLPDTDWGIPDLYSFVGSAPFPQDSPANSSSILSDATVVRSLASRFLIDPNRDPSGGSLYPGRVTTELVPTTTFDGAPVWRDGEAPTQAEIHQRRRTWFDRYHEALQVAIERTRSRHGYAVLWDAHSIRSRVPRLFDGRLPDLNLGTNGGASCHPEVASAAVTAMASQNRWTTVVNGRFTGGWITRYYGRPESGVHALQMEIALGAYAEEAPPWSLVEDRAEPLRATLARIMIATVEAAARVRVGDTPGARPAPSGPLADRPSSRRGTRR
jgi:N-formylglutamate amidohydrolase